MSANHTEEAKARDEEVARLHPGAERRQVRATLPGRVVLRNVEKNEDDPEIGLLAATYLTAVVIDHRIEFYAGSNPVQHAGSVEASRIVDVEVGHEMDYTPPRLNPTLQLKLSEPGSEPLDLELEVFTLDGDGLHEPTDIDDDIIWWRNAIAR